MNYKKIFENIMYKIKIASVCIILLIPIVFFIINIFSQYKSNQEETVFYNTSQKNRTIMIYMIGSNLESSMQMATKDVKEIEESGINLEDNNIVIYAGGTTKWHNHFENNSIYELTDTGFVKVLKEEKASMGEADTLTGFLKYVYENYNSEKYGLIFWDHGAGPIEGYGYDEVYAGDSLKLTEMKESFSNSSYNNSNKLEFVGFDTCLMASIEVAHVLSQYTDYMIASQDMEPEYGWNYKFMSEINSDINAEEIGKKIIDYMNAFYNDSSNFENPDRKFDFTLSMMDLTKVDNLENIINNLFKNVDVSLKHNKYSEVVSNITSAQSFGNFGSRNSYDLVDLYEIAEKLKDKYPEKTELLHKEIKEFIIYQQGNVEGANGISIYYPYYNKVNLGEYLGIYNQLDFAKEYTKFLFNYSKLLIGESDSDIRLNVETLVPVFSDEQNTMQVLLDKTIISNYNKSNYVIFRKMDSGNYMPVYKSSNSELQQNGNLIANIERKQLKVIDSERRPGWCNMLEYSKTENSTVYLIPITMYNFEKDGINIQQMDSAYIKLLVDEEHPKGTIINIIPMCHVNNISAMKSKIDLKKWDFIQFFNFEYEYNDRTDNQCEWINSYNTSTININTNEEFKLEFKEFDKNAEYYGAFQVEDTYGNIYYTNLVKLKNN